jgi:hypothetical protein
METSFLEEPASGSDTEARQVMARFTEQGCCFALRREKVAVTKDAAEAERALAIAGGARTCGEDWGLIARSASLDWWKAAFIACFIQAKGLATMSSIPKSMDKFLYGDVVTISQMVTQTHRFYRARFLFQYDFALQFPLVSISTHTMACIMNASGVRPAKTTLGGACFANTC